MPTPAHQDEWTDDALAGAWRRAAAAPAIAAGLEAVYAMMADAVEVRRPVCSASGRCCNFREAGHLLYVTGLEAAYLMAKVGGGLSGAALAAAVEAGLCPFQTGRLCGVHDWRPMGCRAYYCDPTAQDWQQRLSERSLGAIRRLHDENGVPYRYGEWRAMLGMLLGAPGAGPIESTRR